MDTTIAMDERETVDTISSSHVEEDNPVAENATAIENESDAASAEAVPSGGAAGVEGEAKVGSEADASSEASAIPAQDISDDGNVQSEIATNGADEDATFAELLEAYDFERPRRGQILQGEVLTINPNSILVDVGAKRDAIVPRHELGRVDEEWLAQISVGDAVPVYVLRTPNGSDELQVSLRRGLEEQDWDKSEELLESGDVVELEVVGYNKGGLLVEFNRLRGFVPNSHVPDLRHIGKREKQDEHKGEQIGSTLALKVIEVDRSRRRLVLSEKAARKLQRRERIRELNVGDRVTGTVESIADFGAFVDLDGVTGLVHISRLDWQRVQHPSEVVSVGDEVEVLIEDIDIERERIRLNRQALLPSPWDVVADKYQVGDMLEGEVTNVVDFGAFVQLPEGVEGLVHVSEMGNTFVGSPKEILQPGDTVQVRIINMEPERERLGLTMKQPDPVTEIDWDVMPQPDEDE